MPHYYPLDKIDKETGEYAYQSSGATVGRGVDLGQHDDVRLRKLGVPETIIGKVRPLLGVTNAQGRGVVEEAIASAAPLTLEEIGILDEAFYKDNVSGLISDLGPAIDNISPDLFAHIASSRYRGDMGKQSKTFGLIKSGQYADAAEEFLNHQQYRELKSSDSEDGVVRRMDEMADVLRSYNAQRMASGYKRGGKVRDIYGRSYI